MAAFQSFSNPVTLIIWISIQCVRITTTAWTLSTELFRWSDDEMAVAAYNGNIFIIGGSRYPRQIAKYQINIGRFADLGTTALSEELHGGDAQYWTQQQHMLYTIHFNDGSPSQFNVYNLATGQYTTQWMNITFNTDVYKHGCLSSTEAYLFVTGGGMPNLYTKTVQILSLSAHEWITDAPSMKTERGTHACIATNDYVWVFGGYDGSNQLATNERVRITGIAQNTWSFVDSLTMGLHGLRTTSWNNDIYIIGGNDKNSMAQDLVHIMNAQTGSITVLSDRMPFGNACSAPIIVDGVLYVMGGFWSKRFLSFTYAYYPLATVTPNPKDAPTKPIHTEGRSIDHAPNPNEHQPNAKGSRDTESPTNRPTNHPTNGPATNPPTYVSNPTKQIETDTADHLTLNPFPLEQTMRSPSDSNTIHSTTTKAHYTETKKHVANPYDAVIIISVVALAVVCMCCCLIYVFIFLKRKRKVRQSIMQQTSTHNDHDIAVLATWLETVAQCPAYAVNFVQNGYYNLVQVQQIESQAQLEEMGITELGVQIRLLIGIQTLRENEDNGNNEINADSSEVGQLKESKAYTYRISACMRCGEVKEGRIYIGDNQFYCNQCLCSSEVEVEDEETSVVIGPSIQLVGTFEDDDLYDQRMVMKPNDYMVGRALEENSQPKNEHQNKRKNKKKIPNPYAQMDSGSDSDSMYDEPPSLPPNATVSSPR